VWGIGEEEAVMITRASIPSFLKKTTPAKPSSRMKSKSRKALGADTSEADNRHRRSFLPKPKR
jgi:hypothetical protein